MRRILVTTSAIVAAVAAALPSSAGAGPRNGLVAFTDWRSGTFQIYTETATGGHARQITHGPLEARWPRWSPDGRLLAVARAGDDFLFQLYVSRADGSRMRQLTRGSDSYQGYGWSPDGRSLVAVRMVQPHVDLVCDCNTSSVNQLVVLDLRGHVRKVLYESRNALSSPSWGDNGQIVFAETLAYAYDWAATNSDVVADEIESIDAQGTNRRQIALGTTPTLSRDGSHVLYVADGTEAPGQVSNQLGMTVHEMTIDGTGDRTVMGPGWTAGMPSYAPDGRSFLIMVSAHPDDTYRIERHDLQTGAFLGYLSEPGGNAAAPDEQPLR